MSYNGWGNYETWAVNLWLTNEQGTDSELRRMARRAPNASRLADDLKDWVWEMLPDLGASLAADLLGAAMSEVDWYEIANNHLEEEQTEEEATE